MAVVSQSALARGRGRDVRDLRKSGRVGCWAAMGDRCHYAISTQMAASACRSAKPAVRVSATTRPLRSFQAASPSLECGRSPKCGGSYSDVHNGWIAVFRKCGAIGRDAPKVAVWALSVGGRQAIVDQPIGLKATRVAACIMSRFTAGSEGQVMSCSVAGSNRQILRVSKAKRACSPDFNLMSGATRPSTS